MLGSHYEREQLWSWSPMKKIKFSSIEVFISNLSKSARGSKQVTQYAASIERKLLPAWMDLKPRKKHLRV